MRASFPSVPMMLAATLALGFAGTPAVAGEAGGAKLAATLSGASEVDAQGVAGKGDPDGAGSFAGRLIPGKQQLCYTLTWSGIDVPTMAHIHSGAAGKNGPVFVPLTELGAGEHCIAIDKAKAADLVAKPADFYVNVHNAAYPAGAARGQLARK